MKNKQNREPTWEETIEVFRKRTKKKLAPMLKAMIEVAKEKKEKEQHGNNL
jgi:hypothetical protein